MAFGAGEYDTSAFMAGNIAVSVVFVESNGKIDKSTEDWTAAEISKVVAYLDNACKWWEDMWDRQGYVGDLNFTLDLTYANTPFQSAYEPITRKVVNDDQLWISEFLRSRGYSGSKIDMMYDYNNDLISGKDADFAFTVYVVKADNDADHHFADNYHAYTWGAAGGSSFTYVTMAYSQYYDWYTESPFAHEIGHIFGAADEYPGQGKYTDIKGYYGVQNTNAADGNPNPGNIVVSLMNNSIQKAYKQYTSSPQSLEMIGWRDTDKDGIIDVLDAPINVSNFSSDLQVNSSAYSFSGLFTVGKVRNYSGSKAITINSVDRLVYRYGESGAWLSVNNNDWKMESKEISHSFSLPNDSVLQWKVIDSTGTSESKVYTIGNIRNLQTYVNHEARIVAMSFTPATVDTGIVRYNISIDDTIHNIGVNSTYMPDLAYGNHQWKLQGVYSNSSVTDWISGGSFRLSPKVISSSISGGCNGGSWCPIGGIDSYIVQYSKNNYQTAVSFSVNGSSLSLYNVDNGTYQWRIQCPESPEVSEGQNFSTVNNSPSHHVIAAEDNVQDVIFARKTGVWSHYYSAKHQGQYNGWQGSGELVSLRGKNILSDIFIGNNDKNILVMTDDANGDALFIEDVYSVLGEQARFSMIDEIRAGAGNDLVDLTSQKYIHSTNGVTVYGGLGDDTIWANGGYNTLFGDAGNDRIIGSLNYDVISGGAGNDSLHGGGGNDVFCFGGKWGHDTVEQFADGSVILWFEEDCNGTWDQANMIFSDGISSVKVEGVTADKVSFYFGNTHMVAAGAFSDAASECIFENPNRGMLA